MFKLQQKPQTDPQTHTLLSSCIKQSEQILYLSYNSTTSTLTTACKCSNHTITIRQSSIESSYEIRFKCDKFQMIDVKIQYVFVQGGDAFVVYRDPFIVYFVAKGEEEPIKLILKQEDLRFEALLTDFIAPNLIFYGKKSGQYKSCVYELNMDTLQLKTINDGSGYGPGNRKQQLAVLADGRIYVFGGKDKKNRPCDKMIYVYDMQKGYWFALEMQYPAQQDYRQCEIIPISSSRVLIIHTQIEKAWVLEIHQSRLTQVEEFNEFSERSACVKGQLISYSNAGWKFWGKEVCYYKK